MMGMPNECAAGKGAIAFLFEIARNRLALPEHARYAAMRRPILLLVFLPWLIALVGCTSTPRYRMRELMLFETNRAPLATVQLFLPEVVTTNWSDGEWRGELSPTYVRPQMKVLFASDLLKTSSLQHLRCQIDDDDSRLIHVNLQPDHPMDNIRVWIPLRRRSPQESSWYHWTDGGGFEGGPVVILNP